MKRKIIIFMLCSLLLVSSLSVVAFALEPDTYGDNFDTSHQENGCCNIGGSDIHYNQGYEDGLLDGAPTQEEIDSHKAEAVDSYLKSSEFEKLKLDIYQNGANEAVDSYKGSTEYESTLNEQYTDGVSAGFQGGYEAAYSDAQTQWYDKGWADGKADFRVSSEYALTKEACLDSGYEMGYLEGHNDGYENGMDNSIEPSALFAILFSIVGLVIVLLALSYSQAKKNKKGR